MLLAYFHILMKTLSHKKTSWSMLKLYTTRCFRFFVFTDPIDVWNADFDSSLSLKLEL